MEGLKWKVRMISLNRNCTLELLIMNFCSAMYSKLSIVASIPRFSPQGKEAKVHLDFQERGEWNIDNFEAIWTQEWVLQNLIIMSNYFQGLAISCSKQLWPMLGQLLQAS